MNPTTTMAIAGGIFLGHHLVSSHRPIRERLIAALGAGGFRIGYAAVAAVSIGVLGWTWWTNRHAGDLLWELRSMGWTSGLNEVLSVVGVAMLVGGAIRPAPSSMMSSRVDAEGAALGVTAITRHPVNMGIALWATGHLIVNGWVGDILFFGTLLLTAVFGSAHQDARLKAARDDYGAFCEQTAFFPFAKPGNLARLGKVGFAMLAAGSLVGVVLRVFHVSLFG